MATIAFTSAKGAPGVSTACLALALTWPRPVLLVDADPAGGDLLAGFYRGEQPAGLGVLALTLQARRSSMGEHVWSQVLPLAETKPAWLLAGVSAPRQVRSVDWAQLAAILPGVRHGQEPVDTLVDLGRLRSDTEATHPDSTGPEQLARTADLVVLVLAGSLPAVRAAQLRVEQLRTLTSGGTARTGRLVGLLVGGPRPYGAAEIARELDIPVAATLPADTGSAGTLMAGAPARRGWRHAPLMRAASATADLLVELSAAQRPEGPPAAPQPQPVMEPAAGASRSEGWAPLPTAPTAAGGERGR